MFMNKFLSLAAVAALFAAYNASPVLANDQANAQEEELAYAHEGDKAEMKGKAHKKADVKKHAKKADMKSGEKAKHHPHNPMKHKPHHEHNYYTDQQK